MMILIKIWIWFVLRFPGDEHASDSSGPSRARRLRKRIGLRKSRIPVRTLLLMKISLKQLYLMKINLNNLFLIMTLNLEQLFLIKIKFETIFCILIK
jgi:hypothetical protein